MEVEPRTVAEKEVVVANVDFADAVKDLSPWVCTKYQPTLTQADLRSDDGVCKTVLLSGPNCSCKYDEWIRWLADGKYQHLTIVY